MSKTKSLYDGQVEIQFTHAVRGPVSFSYVKSEFLQGREIYLEKEFSKKTSKK